MTTPATTSLSRRSFIGRLAAAAGLAPLVGAAIAKPATPEATSPEWIDGSPGQV